MDDYSNFNIDSSFLKNTTKNVFKFDITMFIQNDMKRKIIGQQEMEKNIETLRKGPRE